MVSYCSPFLTTVGVAESDFKKRRHAENSFHLMVVADRATSKEEEEKRLTTNDPDDQCEDNEEVYPVSSHHCRVSTRSLRQERKKELG